MPPNDGYLDGYEILVYFLTPLALIGNVILTASTFMVLRRGSDLPVVYLCLCSIALADFINSTNIVTGLLYRNTARLKYHCASQTGVMVSCNISAMLSICFLAIERFCFVVQGCGRKSILTPAKAAVIIIFIWLTGFCCGLTPAIIEAEKTKATVMDSCDFTKIPISAVISLAMIAIPLMVITSCIFTNLYIHTMRKTKKKAGNTKNMRTSKLKSIALLSMLSNSYIISWGPYIIGTLIFRCRCEPRDIDCSSLYLALSSPLAVLAFLSFVLNIFIYIWWHKPYHHGVKQIFCGNKSKARRRQTLAEVTIKPNSNSIYFVGS